MFHSNLREAETLHLTLCPPLSPSVSHLQLLVAEVHRRVVMEYLRSVMRGRIICTSMKMRKRMAGRLRDEGNQIKVLFKDLVSV